MKAAHKFSWLVVDRGIRLLTTFANTAVIARSLGPNEYGDFAKGFLVFTFADSLCSLGIPVVLAGRIASGYSGNRMALLIKSIAARVTAGAIVYLLLGSYAVFTGLHFSGEAVIAGMLLGLFTSQWALGDAFLQGVGEPQRGAMAKIVVASSFTALRIGFLVALKPRIGIWVGLFVFEHFVLTAIMLIQCRRHSDDRDVAQTEGAVRGRSLRNDAFYVWASQMATLLYMRIDQVALAAISTPAALASYSIASQLIEQAYTVPVIINSVTISELGRANQEPGPRFHRRMVLQYAWGIVLGVLCCVIMAVVGRLVVVKLYGPGFQLARSLVPILAMSIPFVTVGTLQVSEIVLCKSSKILLWKAISSAVLSAPLAVLGWYSFGVKGLAASAVAVQIFSCVILNYWVDRDTLKKQIAAIWYLFEQSVGGARKWRAT